MTAEESSLRFWTVFGEIGFVLVIVGVVGESAELLAKLAAWRFRKHISEKGERFLLVTEVCFWAMLVIGLAMEFSGGIKVRIISAKENDRLKFETASLMHSNLVLQTKLLELESAVRELAHLYDQSTNALAEAKARLMAIRPLKPRLVECLNEIDPAILPALRGGRTKFELRMPMHNFIRLSGLCNEAGSSSYISSVVLSPTLSAQAGLGQVQDLVIELKQELVK